MAQHPWFMQDPGKHLAVPCHLVSQQLRGEIEQGLEAPLEPRTCLVGNCRIETFLLPEKLRGWLGERLPFVRGEDTLCFEGRFDDRIIPVLAPASVGQAEVTVNEEEEKEDSEKASVRKHAADTYQEELKFLSCLTGKRFVLHRSAPQPCEPFPRSGDTLHLVAGSSPPGDFVAESRRYIFGCKVEERGWWVECRMPTYGRGFVAKSTEGEPVVQLLDTTLYLLIPILSYYHGMESELIFRALLAAAWNLWLDVEAGKVDPFAEVEGSAAFTTKLRGDIERVPDVWKKELEKTEHEIDQARKKLADLFRQRREWESIKRASEQDGWLLQSMDRIDRDYAAICAHPLVARVFTCDEGLHVETKLVSIEHEGRRYPIGRFAIRFGKYSRCSVWCIEKRHPAGVPHPHMPRNRTPCFGTATESLAKACGEYRFADAINLIMRWLEDGYLPESADAKIAEWPEEAT